MSQTVKPEPIPDRYRRVTPALVVDGAAKALEFYAAVFNAAERLRFSGPDGAIAHAEIEIGDSVVIVEDASPHMGTQAPPATGLDGTPVFLYIYVEDVDAVIDRAAQLGATVKRAAQNQFYGDRDGFIVDPFGHAWTVASHVEDIAPDEIMARMSEFADAGAGSNRATTATGVHDGAQSERRASR